MPVLKGLDTTMELTRHAQALKEQGYAFALRYYSPNAAKNLSLGEARALSHPDRDGGLFMVKPSV